MPSLVHQVEMALAPLIRKRPKGKKGEMPPEERACWIWSYRTLENYLQWCCWWAEWSQDHLGLRRLVDAHLMGQPFVQYLIDYKGDDPEDSYSPWTIAGTISALRKLETGIRFRWHRKVPLIVPESLHNRRERLLGERKRKGHYPTEDLHQLRAHVDHLYLPALDACLALGLRRHEVISVQASDVDLGATTYRVKGPENWAEHAMPSGYAGLVRVRKGKGGRPREVPVPTWFRPTLAEACLRAASSVDRLWPVQAKAFGYEIIRACREARITGRGVHGLRHSWALSQYSRLLGIGYTDHSARQLVSWWLGHNRLAVTVSYIPRKVELAPPVFGEHRT